MSTRKNRWKPTLQSQALLVSHRWPSCSRFPPRTPGWATKGVERCGCQISTPFTSRFDGRMLPLFSPQAAPFGSTAPVDIVSCDNLALDDPPIRRNVELIGTLPRPAAA